MESWELFQSLFTGSDLAHGEWDQNREPKALTRHVGPQASHYLDHLEGKLGLGVVPVNSSGISYFGAIDIDVDTISHATLLQNVQELGLPLNVCRSKSGGAHLYAFFQPPGLPAMQVQALLKRWAGMLGYPRSEIFPKQRQVGPGNDGNWINLPYFGGDTTTRYCVGPSGSLSLTEFLSSVRYYDPKVPEKIVKSTAQLPPCLASMTETGVTSGFRNQTLFNLAVFYRKSSPATWEQNVREHNAQYFSPALDIREVSGIISSANRGTYQYTCDQPPLNGVCNRPLCLTLPFGVGNSGNVQANGDYDDLIVKACRKLCSNPPKYIVEVSGKDITLSWDELFQYRLFRSRVGEELDLVVGGMKQQTWEQQVRVLLVNKVDIETPDDASMIGLVVDKLHEFLVLRERATEKEDLLRGLPVQEGAEVLFRATDFKRYLQGYKLDRLELSDIFLVIQRHGARHRRVRLSGRQITIWSYPIDQIHEQQQDFKVPDFAKDFEV